MISEIATKGGISNTDVIEGAILYLFRQMIMTQMENQNEKQMEMMKRIMIYAGIDMRNMAPLR
jgi:hypothetical protein